VSLELLLMGSNGMEVGVEREKSQVRKSNASSANTMMVLKMVKHDSLVLVSAPTRGCCTHPQEADSSLVVNGNLDDFVTKKKIQRQPIEFPHVTFSESRHCRPTKNKKKLKSNFSHALIQSSSQLYFVLILF